MKRVFSVPAFFPCRSLVLLSVKTYVIIHRKQAVSVARKPLVCPSPSCLRMQVVFFFSFLTFAGIQLIYNVVLVSGIQQSESVIYKVYLLQIYLPCPPQFLLMSLSCSVTQSCPTLCNPMGCSPPGSSVHRILQARVLE